MIRLVFRYSFCVFILGPNFFSYILQISGYLIMLVVMTYSLPLFISVIAGFMGGHALFLGKDIMEHQRLINSKDHEEKNATIENGSTTPRLSQTSCGYGTVQNGTDGMEALPSCCSRPTSSVPEGCTPCCQNDV
jgi:hypothetical protein